MVKRRELWNFDASVIEVMLFQNTIEVSEVKALMSACISNCTAVLDVALKYLSDQKTGIFIYTFKVIFPLDLFFA